MRDVIGCEGMCGGYVNRWVARRIINVLLFPVEELYCL